MKKNDTVLVRFKVNNFRSIEESNWIDISENSCLIGTNESGKTNLLVALWKLNPVNKEPIVPLDDFPRLLFSKYKAEGHENDIFISADFLLSTVLQEKLATEYKCDQDQVKTVLVQRKYNGDYQVSFPYTKIEQFETSRLTGLYEKFEEKIQEKDLFTKEDDALQKLIIEYIQNLKKIKSRELF